MPSGIFQLREVVDAAQRGANYVASTGTGSGKSLIYLLPIYDAIMRDAPERDCGVRENAENDRLRERAVALLPGVAGQRGDGATLSLGPRRLLSRYLRTPRAWEQG